MVQLINFVYLLNTLLISFSVCLILIPIFRICAFKFNIVDAPDGKLKRHEKITPYFGGLSIYFGTLVTLLLRFNFEGYWLFLLSATLLMFLGLVDDIFVLKPFIKFFGQIISISVLSFGDIFFKQIFINSFFTLLIDLFWILSIINAFNLIDVMDGLCCSTAILSCLGFVFVSLIYNQALLCILLVAFLGALIAFLFYNFPPAKIYLGDSGSMFIGGFLAVIPFFIHWDGNFTAFSSTFLLFLVPILELVALIIIRYLKGIPVYLGSPDHFSIYLRNKGWSKNKILFFVALINSSLILIVILNILKYISLPALGLLLTPIIVAWLYFIFVK